MATKTATRAPAKAKATEVAPEDFQRVEGFLNRDVLLEREQELRILLRVLIAAVNGHLIGGGGVAKSLTLKELAHCITGANYFGKTLQPGTPPEAVIGPYDYAAMAQGGTMERNFDGFLPDAHIGFIDELLRSSGLMRDALMPLLNTTEREAEGNGGMVKTDLRALFTASNTWFEPDDPYTSAISDRVTVMVEVAGLQAADSFKTLLVRDHERRQAIAAGTFESKRETITLDQLRQAQREVAAVRLSPEFIDAMAGLWADTKAAGLEVSERRWIELGYLCRAKAWLAGRDVTAPEDLIVCEHGMWRLQEEQPTARKLVAAFRSVFAQRAEERREEAEGPFAEIERLRPTVDAAPTNIPSETLQDVINVMRALKDVRKRVDADLAEAQQQQSSADELRVIADEIAQINAWSKGHSLPVA